MGQLERGAAQWDSEKASMAKNQTLTAAHVQELELRHSQLVGKAVETRKLHGRSLLPSFT